MASEAEQIYQKWSTRGSRAAVTPESFKGGSFDAFRKGGGFDIVKTRLTEYLTKKGSRSAAEQTWKLLEKFKRRNGELVAVEAMRAVETDLGLKSALAQFPASMFPNLNEDAVELSKKLDPNNIRFPTSGITVRIVKMLGKGGAGGAVYLAKDTTGKKYALKQFNTENYAVPSYTSTTNQGRLNRTKFYMMKYFEASLTTTCIDALTVGRTEFILLQLGEGAVDYTKLNMSDLMSVFDDLSKLENYSQNHMNVEVTQDVSVLHGDIHGENLMRFEGKLRLIDFGFAVIFSPGQEALVRRATPIDYDKDNPLLYIQDSGPLEDKKKFYDPQGGWKDYIANWQKAYREAPVVQLCESCRRQYPAGLKITECYRCGSKKIVTSNLRRADIQGIARLKGVSPGTIGDNPYADGEVKQVNPKEYACIVMTAVLIKEIWAATEKGRDLGMGGTKAKSIVNTEVYPKARTGLYKFSAESQSGVVQLLLLWFDEMMRRLFDGESFTAKDAVVFFGGNRSTKPSVQRRHSVAF
jgi:hypothetical protein